MRMLTGNPVSSPADGAFALGPFPQALASTVRDTDRPPFWISVFGERGTGKSSLMILTMGFPNDRVGMERLSLALGLGGSPPRRKQFVVGRNRHKPAEVGS